MRIMNRGWKLPAVICISIMAIALWPVGGKAQVNGALTYNSTSVGKNFTVNLGKRFTDHEFGVGLGLNIKERLNYPGIYENIYPTENAHYLNFNPDYSIEYLSPHH